MSGALWSASLVEAGPRPVHNAATEGVVFDASECICVKTMRSGATRCENGVSGQPLRTSRHVFSARTDSVKRTTTLRGCVRSGRVMLDRLFGDRFPGPADAAR